MRMKKPDFTSVNLKFKLNKYCLRIENLQVTPSTPIDYQFETIGELSNFIYLHNKQCVTECEYKIRINKLAAEE